MLNFNDAEANCKTQFGGKRSGKLFEPRTVKQNNQVHSAAHHYLKKHNTWLNDMGLAWLGIRTSSDL